MPAPTLKLKLVDVYGKALQQPTTVVCRNQMTGRISSFSASGGKTQTLRGLDGAPNGVYLFQIDPAVYLPCAAFVSIPAAGAVEKTMTFPIDPAKVEAIAAPAFASLPAAARDLLKQSVGVAGFAQLSGRDLYDELDDFRKAGFLNIMTKSSATPLANGRTVFSYFTALEDLRGDRFFCTVPQALRDDVKNSALGGLFHAVGESLHHPPEGFSHAGSFKTPDHYGNLQLTFFAGPDRWVADVDIDDAGGLGHVFQVVRNSLTGRPTHPYDIHEILMMHQGLDAGYRFVTAS